MINSDQNSVQINAIRIVTAEVSSVPSAFVHKSCLPSRATPNSMTSVIDYVSLMFRCSPNQLFSNCDFGDLSMLVEFTFQIFFSYIFFMD